MVKKSTGILTHAVQQVWTHPRPWILRYSVSFGAALFLSMMITLPLWNILTQSYITPMLDRRNLDMLFDILINIREGESHLMLPLVTSALAGLVWIPVQIVYIWLEGGTLCFYASENTLDWRAFFSASNKWFGFMLLVKMTSSLLMICVVVIAVVIGVILRMLWRPLMWGVFAIGLLVNLCVFLFFEITRSTAVVRGERHLFRVIRYTLECISKDIILLLTTLTLPLIFIVLFLIFQRWVSKTVPVSWWLVSFIILQITAMIRHGLRLLRQCSEISFIQIQS